MSNGFFDGGVYGLGLCQQASAPRKKSVKLANRVLGNVADPCNKCGLYQSVKTPRMGITGEGRLGILYMGEAPGEQEDIKGKQFCGDAGGVLRQFLQGLGIDFERDFYAHNSVRCRPTKVSSKGSVSNRTPTDHEIALCWQGVWNLVREVRPRVVILAGLSPLQSYLLDKHQEQPTMTRWRGWTIPDQDLKCWVMPQYHPSYVMRSQHNRGLNNLFRQDLQRALEIAQQPVRIYEPEHHIRIIDHDGDVVTLLSRVLDEKPEFLVEDFETTGLKPHRSGHDIKYAAICYDGTSYAFRTSHPEVRRLLGEINACPDIGLGSHNVQFEDLWCRVILGVRPTNWVWDSEVAAHVLDDRTGIISLAFQAAVRYGDWTFKLATDPYLKPPNAVYENGTHRKTGSNDFNRIDECPAQLILERVARDALYGYWLSLDQMQEIQAEKPLVPGFKTLLDANWFFLDSTLALGESLTDGGIIYDERHFNALKAQLSDEVSSIAADIQATKPASIWRQRKGSDINPGSDTQVRELLFRIYKLPPTGYTETERESVTQQTLQQYETHPEVGAFCRLTVEYNRRVKLLSTYIDGYAREAVAHPDLPDGKLVIYPFIGVTIPRSYRSSSRNPNFQNIPKRDEYSRRAIRDGLYPWPGHRLLAADYGAHEFCIAANYSKDPEMIRYLREGGDPHGDQAMRIFMVTKEEMVKPLRQIVKGGWVFAMLYGSTAAWQDKQGAIHGVAPYLWEETAKLALANGVLVHDHLAAKGIKNFEAFVEHCKAEEVAYWNRFAGLRAWQQEWLARYDRDGCVPMLHGFRRSGLLSRNEIYNTSIQGTGYHLIQEAYNELNRIRHEEQWQSKLIGEIHDENLASCHPDEFEYLAKLFVWVMRDLMQERYSDFLVAPLTVELQATEVDMPWSTIKPYRIPDEVE